MPQLDAMLRALVDRGATELRLSDGDRPVFRFPDGDRPVSQTTLARARILALVGELAEEDDAARVTAGERAGFLYRLADGRSFVCEVGGSDPSVVARILPDPVPVPDPPPLQAPAPAPDPPRRMRPEGRTIDTLLVQMFEMGASDLHLSSGEIPMVRLHGEIQRLDEMGVFSAEDAGALLRPLMPLRYAEQFQETSDTDFAHEIPGVARFRCNIFADNKGIGGVFRVIPSKIPTVQDLMVPKAVIDLCQLHKGLVLVTGPTGSGKSTTLAALVDHINSTRTDHIITIEDPIEFVHKSRKCLVNQREVGTHTKSFRSALRAALREDPDIVLVGEMRDLETIAIAIETAETGHLVFGTLHTSTAASTVDRVIDQFPADRQDQIRVMVAESLKGVVSQTLCRKIGGGRVAALEVLIGTLAIANLIREGKSYQIPSIMQTGRKQGMMLLNEALMDLVRKKLIAPEEAYLKSIDKVGIVSQLKTVGYEPPVAAQAQTPVPAAG